MGVTLPLVLMAYDYFFMRERKKSKSRMKYIYTALLVVAVVFSMLTLDVSTGQKRTSLYGGSRYLTSLGMLGVVVEYMKLSDFEFETDEVVENLSEILAQYGHAGTDLTDDEYYLLMDELLPLAEGFEFREAEHLAMQDDIVLQQIEVSDPV